MAENLLYQMSKELEEKYNAMDAEQIFSIYDLREKGFIARD